MATVKLPFQNPHVSLVNDDVLLINYRGKRLKIALTDINKIYLSKRKTNYLSALIGNLLISRTTGFKFYIHNKENAVVSFDIVNDDKFYFVSLISWVRSQIIIANTVPPTKLKPQPQPSHEAVAA